MTLQSYHSCILAELYLQSLTVKFCQLLSYPTDYFAALDQSGKRTDSAERPEINRGSVEFAEPAEYMVRPPMLPVHFLVSETKPSMIDSGVLVAVIYGMRNSIHSMLNEGRTWVATITFDSAIKFYALRAGLDGGTFVYVVSDIEDFLIAKTE